MTYSSSPFFVMLFNSMDVYLAIAVRLIGFSMQAPILSHRSIPTLYKICFSVVVSLLIFFSEIVVDIEYVNSFLGYGTLLLTEFTIGYILGFGVFLFFTTFYMAGQFIDYQIGFSMVNVLDPASQIQVPITGNFLYLGISTIFVVSGAFHVVLDAFLESYTLIPIGTGNVFGNSVIAYHFIDIMYVFFNLSLLIAIPVVGTIILVDIALGLLVKTVPQMNVFVVGAPIKLIVGLFIFMFIIPNLHTIFESVFDMIMDSFEVMIRGMSG
ncbi:MAG: flagellar biosynthetic protein FliR [Lachnospirales bacterium]